MFVVVVVFFFKQKTAYEMRISDWSSDVCSSDLAVRYVLDMKFRSGLFENPYADVATAEAITNDADARALALEAAQKSIVLLKNDGLLPLKPTGTIAGVGPHAATAHLGGSSGIPPHPENGRGVCGEGECETV